jgi:hypothetical protein
MTAAEARTKAAEVNTNDENSQYATIKEMIGEAVKKGEFDCWIYNTAIKTEVRAKLINEGYKVGPTQSDRGETLTQIKW